MRCKGGLRHLHWVAWRKSKEQCEWGIGAPEETHSSGANRCMGFSSPLRKEHKGERLDTAFFIYKKISAMALEARFFYNIVRPVGSLSMVTFLWWEWLEIGRIRSVVCGKICLAHGTVLFFSSFLMRLRLVQLFFFIARLFVTTCPQMSSSSLFGAVQTTHLALSTSHFQWWWTFFFGGQKYAISIKDSAALSKHIHFALTSRSHWEPPPYFGNIL